MSPLQNALEPHKEAFSFVADATCTVLEVAGSDDNAEIGVMYDEGKIDTVDLGTKRYRVRVEGDLADEGGGEG